MLMTKSFRTLMATAALAVLAGGAQAATCTFGSDPSTSDVVSSTACIGANDHPSGLLAASDIANLGGFSDWSLVGKSDASETSPYFAIVDFGATSGTWKIPNPDAGKTYALSLKAGNSFAAYVLSGFSGDWTTNALTNSKGEPQDLSNAVLFSRGVSAIPLPAAGWLMIAGLGGLAAVGRRRRG